MLFENVDIIDERFEHQPNRWVGVCDGFITYVGDKAPADAASFGERYDGRGKLLMPALYNAHTHSSMTLLRGYAENLPLQIWLNEKVFPFEAKMMPEDCYWGTLLSCAEMARFGVVSFSDMYYHMDHVARAVEESGLKANLCDDLLALNGERLDDLPLRATVDQLISEVHGRGGGRVLIDCGVHSEYTTNPGAVADMAEYAAKHGLRMQLHCSETRLEREECKQRHDGMTPIKYFESLGVLDLPTTAAHCVWVDDEDIRIMVERGVSVAANPVSNMKLGSGFAPIARMLEAGVNVCVGTDGMASNNNYDMLQDLYVLALISKGSMLDPSVVSPKQVLFAGTRAGALSQGRDDCGLIAVGMRADLCVLDVAGPSWTPMTNPLFNVVFSGHGSDVVLTMCDGRVVYRDGEWPTVDVERAKAEVTARTNRIIG
ncbi:amidohydrolase family protein [Adlercreutzia sp. ZJ141]|uniref:amidohydrolase family protein n=1 Tax=Adlercreutzia sp. ZJ141 TaxID=2709406 RepID=UPI0013E9A45B|nr:amidohydrolase [Adlercreutzia sp. ZJ141]